jgi:hypothetical protein
MHFLTLAPLLFALPTFAELRYVDFPHLLIPLVRSDPDKAYGTKPDATVSNDILTELSFDVRGDIPNVAICRINFHINTDKNKNAPKELKGIPPLQFQVTRLEPEINKDTDTYNDHPSPLGNAMATITLHTDWSVEVKDGWFACPFGGVAQFILHPVGAKNFNYSWYELDYPESEGGPHGITLEMHS